MMGALTAILVVLIGTAVGWGQPVGIFTGQASVGDDAGGGFVTFDNNVYIVEGSGNDIWDAPDGFFWIYMEYTGDFLATATVEWQTPAAEGDYWKKAGIIARNTVDDPTRTDGEYACAALIQNHLSNFFIRPNPTTDAEDTFHNENEDISIYTNTIQLKREGDRFSMLRQLKSGGFVELGFKVIDMQDTILLGLCVTSHDTRAIEIASFTNVSIVPGSTDIHDFVLYE